MESVFFSNSILFSFSLIALFCIVTAYFVSHKTVSAIVSVCGALIAIFCVTYALLLGAGLYEVLAFVLVLTAISVLTFLPQNKNGNKKLNNKNSKTDFAETNNSDEYNKNGNTNKN